MKDKLRKLWDEAEKNLGMKINIGKIVVCDVCGEDFTDRPDEGGIIFGSNAYCPACAISGLPNIKKYGEEKYIKAMCPDGVSFAGFVRGYRGENNFICITEGRVKNEP